MDLVSSGKVASISSGPFLVSDVARLYNFPTDLNGHGQSIGIIEFGGDYRDSDLDTYFTQLKLPKPKVTWVSVDGTQNSPGDSGKDAQVTVDIEVAGAVAPGARIVLYFAPFTPEGWINAIRTAVADTVNRPSVLLIGWGRPESEWTSDAMNEINRELQTAAARSITVITVAGDQGVTDGVDDGQAHVNFPASSPWVLTIGGTRLKASKDAIASEVVWNDGALGGATGCGVSAVFSLPDWQLGVSVPAHKDGGIGRGIPDVASNASPSSGYLLYLQGRYTIVGGTSIAAPLWAGLIALINQGVGRNIGYINPALYSTIGPAGGSSQYYRRE